MMGSNKYLPLYYGEKESAEHFVRLSDLFKDKYFQYAFLRHLTAAHTASLADGSTAMLLERVANDFRFKPGAI